MSGSKTTQTNKALPQYGDAYSSLLQQAQQTGSTPYTPYTGQLTAPLSADQQTASTLANNVAGTSGYATAQPYFDAAQGYYSAATTPLWDSVQQFSPDAIAQYESPYTQSVVDATQNQFNLQNAQQQAQLKGNVAAAGAFGGDRQAVLEAELAGQQQAAQAPVIAGLYNTGYTNALNEFNTEQANQLGANATTAGLNLSAGSGIAGLGTTAQQLAQNSVTGLSNTGAAAQTTQEAADEAALQQWQQQQQYPFAELSWLSGLETSLGGAAGSTATSKQSNSLLSSIFGGLESAAGLAGLFKRGGGIAPRKFGTGRGLPVIHGFADGGAFDDPAVPANDTEAFVPERATGTDGMPFPNVDYQPVTVPNTWAHDAANAPWLALLQAGGETLASGNIGKGITAGVQSYAAARQAAQEAEAKGIEAQNVGLYRQADVRNAANKLWQDAQDAKARIKHEDAQMAQTKAFQDAEIQNMEKGRELEAQRIGVEGQGSWQFVGTDPATNLPIMLNSRSGQTVLGKSPIGAKPSANDPNFGGAVMPWQRYKPVPTPAPAQPKPWQLYGGQ